MEHLNEGPGERLTPFGPTAIVSYLSIVIFAGSLAAVFAVVFLDVAITTPQAGILGTALGASVTGFGTVLQFWVGGNIGTKAATRALERAAAAPTTNVTAPAAATQIVNPNALDSSPRADLDIPPEPTP